MHCRRTPASPFATAMASRSAVSCSKLQRYDLHNAAGSAALSIYIQGDAVRRMMLLLHRTFDAARRSCSRP